MSYSSPKYRAISSSFPLPPPAAIKSQSRSTEMWKYRVLGSAAALLLLSLAVSYTQTEKQSAGVMAEDAGPLAGGIHDSPVGRENDLGVLDLARFAVSEHNKQAVRPPSPSPLSCSSLRGSILTCAQLNSTFSFATNSTF